MSHNCKYYPMVLVFIILGFIPLSLASQFPEYTNEVLDLNMEPRLISNFDVDHFFPARHGGDFFYSFHGSDPNPIFYFNSGQLDTAMVDATINGRAIGETSNGFLLYTNNGEGSAATYYFDPITFDTTLLINRMMIPIFSFMDGRTILNAEEELFIIDDGPESFDPLGLRFPYLESTFTNFNDRMLAATTDGTILTNGTMGGTINVTKEIPEYGSFTVRDTLFYFRNNDRTVYVSDGTKEGTLPLDFSWLPENQRPESGVGEIYPTREAAVFLSYGPQGDSQLWRTEGKPENTYYLTKVRRDHVIVGDSAVLFRSGEDGKHEIWISDGTMSGTHMIHKYRNDEIANEDWEIRSIARLETGRLYFTVSVNSGDSQLYFLEKGGQSLVEVTLPTGGDGYPDIYLPTKNQLFVMRRKGNNGLYLHEQDSNELTLLAQFERLEGYSILPSGGIIAQGETGYNQNKITVVYYQGIANTYNGHLGTNVSGSRPGSGTLSLAQNGRLVYGISTTENKGEAIISFDLVNGSIAELYDLYPYTNNSNADDLQAGDQAAFFNQGGVFYGISANCQYDTLFMGRNSLQVIQVPDSKYCLLYDPVDSGDWYLSDGTKSGTTSLGSPPFEIISPLLELNGKFYFLTGSYDFARSGYNTDLISLDINSGDYTKITNQPFFDLDPRKAFSTDGKYLYFSNIMDGKGEVWRSDGTMSGTEIFFEVSSDTELTYAFDFIGNPGAITFKTSEVDNNDYIAKHYLIRNYEDEPVLLLEGSSLETVVPIIINGQTYYEMMDTIYRLPENSNTSISVTNLTGQGIDELAYVDDTTLVFTTFRYDDASLWKLNLLTETPTRLFSPLEQRFPNRTGGISILDSMVLIDYRIGVSDGLALVNVHNGAHIKPHTFGYVSSVSKIVSTNNHFVYIAEASVYGKEVYIIDFGECQNSTVGTQNNPDQLNAIAYPNPTEEQLYIEVPESSKYQYRLMNMNGQTMKVGEFEGRHLILQLNDYPPNMYLLQLHCPTTNQSTSMRLIVK